MTHLESIEKGLQDNLSHLEIIRKVYLTYPTMALVDDEERQFLILNEISTYFNIPITNIQVVGSAKTGKSFHKSTPFTPQTSDLDIAIIDYNLFRLYSEFVFEISKGFNDRSQFPMKNGHSTFNQYTECISKGIFRPDLMIYCTKRGDWFKFFGKLSANHKDLFKNINAGIYMSQLFFEQKQSSIINDYLSKKTI